MATDARATAFVTGAAGFIGLELVKVLVARQHRVFGLTDSIEAAECVRRASGRHFLVNREPIRQHEFASAFARLAKRPLWVFRIPAVAIRLVVGPALADHLRADGLFSNTRLRGTGFCFLYPTLDAGLRQVLGALHE